ncbi:hypothetical protein LOD99_14644 [Oopsacas minuta]|uniref:Uncharacterized protein n=1 Tax=Oopsacas minuta TaxID=111878 RepID=A0AAV7KCM7_9METZ|nr:hypothetical protein LOD99_14644 [Oopsacas minuta]
MDYSSSTPKKKKRDQNLVRSIEADLDRLRDEVLRTREELEYEKTIRRTAEEQLNQASQHKFSDSQSLEAKLQQMQSQLEDSNMAVAKLSAEKADLMIQLELTGSDLVAAEAKLRKMQKDHSTNLQDKSELLEEINQLVDVMNSEKSKYEQELAELSKLRNDNSNKLRNKNEAVEEYQREIGDRDVILKRLQFESEALKTKLDDSILVSDNQKLKIKELEKIEVEQTSLRDNLSQLRKLNKELVETNNRLLENKNQLFDHTIQAEQQEALILSLKEDKLTAERQTHRLQEQLHSKEMGIEDLESKRLNTMQKEVEQLASSLGELMAANNNQQNVICSLHDSVRKKDTQLSNLKSFKQDCEATIAKLRSESSALQSQLLEVETNDVRVHLQSELASLNKLRSEDEEKMKCIISQNRTIENQKQEVIKSYSKLVEENNKRSLQLSKLKQRAKQQETENTTLKDKLLQSETVMRTQSNDIDNLKEALKIQSNRKTSVTTRPEKSTYSAPSVTGKRSSSSHSIDYSSGDRELLQELQNLRASYHEMQSVCKQLEHQLADERSQKDNMFDSNQLQQIERPANEGVRTEQNMTDTHVWYQDRIYNLENELAIAKCSSENLAKANKFYEINLEDESQKRINQGQEARKLMQESRETIRELRERTSQAEDDQTHSQRVISQLSQRLIKSIQDYKYLQEISMTRCQELALEAKPKM